MPVEVTCPTCDARHRAPDSAAGGRFRCPACSGAVVVPEPDDALQPLPLADDGEPDSAARPPDEHGEHGEADEDAPAPRRARPVRRRPDRAPGPRRSEGGGFVPTVTMVAGALAFALGLATLALGAATLLAEPDPAARVSREDLQAAVKHARLMGKMFNWLALMTAATVVVAIGGTAMLVAGRAWPGRRPPGAR